jgi:hypothetical protein
MRYELISGSVPVDAVLVSIWRQHGRAFADVAHITSNSDQNVAADFHRPVRVALKRAGELASECGLERVIIALADPSGWDLSWGELVGSAEPASPSSTQLPRVSSVAEAGSFD